MHRHRSTQPRISNEPQNSNFEASTALENLRAEVVDIEALARAAEAAADSLPRRRRIGSAWCSGGSSRSPRSAHRADGGTPEGGGALTTPDHRTSRADTGRSRLDHSAEVLDGNADAPRPRCSRQRGRVLDASAVFDRSAMCTNGDAGASRRRTSAARAHVGAALDAHAVLDRSARGTRWRFRRASAKNTRCSRPRGRRAPPQHPEMQLPRRSTTHRISRCYPLPVPPSLESKKRIREKESHLDRAQGCEQSVLVNQVGFRALVTGRRAISRGPSVQKSRGVRRIVASSLLAAPKWARPAAEKIVTLTARRRARRYPRNSELITRRPEVTWRGSRLKQTAVDGQLRV